MRYYKPRQRIEDRKWDYTVQHDKVVWSVGYCCEYREFGPLDIISEEERTKYQSTSHKHHSNGHNTPEEACDCYKEYLLDHHLRISTNENEQHKCVVCGEWTQRTAEIDLQMWDLCERHCNREEVSKLFRAPGECWAS